MNSHEEGKQQLISRPTYTPFISRLSSASSSSSLSAPPAPPFSPSPRASVPIEHVVQLALDLKSHLLASYSAMAAAAAAPPQPAGKKGKAGRNSRASTKQSKAASGGRGGGGVWKYESMLKVWGRTNGGSVCGGVLPV